MKIYKIQRTDTKQFKTAVNYNSGWSGTGKIWHRRSDLSLHISYHQQFSVLSNNYFGVPINLVQILEYQLGQAGVRIVPLETFIKELKK
jgi:hypothetical protein